MLSAAPASDNAKILFVIYDVESSGSLCSLTSALSAAEDITIVVAIIGDAGSVFGHVTLLLKDTAFKIMKCMKADMFFLQKSANFQSLTSFSEANVVEF